MATEMTWINLDGSPVALKTCRHCGEDVSTVAHRKTVDGFGCFTCEIERDPAFAASMRS